MTAPAFPERMYTRRTMVMATLLPESIPRQRGLRTLLLSLLLFCFLGLLTVEAYHRHKNLAEEDHCPLCQLAVHLPFEASPPPPAVVAGPVLLFQRISHGWVSTWLVSSPRAAYLTRAPPAELLA